VTPDARQWREHPATQSPGPQIPLTPPYVNPSEIKFWGQHEHRRMVRREPHSNDGPRRHGTLSGGDQFVQESDRAYAPQTARARLNRDNDSSLPKIASVASMGGDTVPPQTARRMGCASLPSEMPLAAANPLMTS
jgi:hypothetical protein